MNRLLLLLAITAAACTQEKRFENQTVPNKTLDSLNLYLDSCTAYTDSLLLDYNSFKKEQVDKATKNLY